MRISDWSSDVCSSDLSFRAFRRRGRTRQPGTKDRRYWLAACPAPEQRGHNTAYSMGYPGGPSSYKTDRQSVAQGKSVDVRVDLGGRSIITKQKTNHIRADGQ